LRDRQQSSPALMPVAGRGLRRQPSPASVIGPLAVIVNVPTGGSMHTSSIFALNA
jgi:hypothetical protein